ncbi:hypothetical protein [Nitratireductor sp. OM-1]|uniref:hypothetical protein n=1 Tax=Nitratireductor sp. OM-1 TaxID=1756988 RepID=UPI0013AFC28F|nr:hypothetical protein [Nitratireductor sp. OM-1]
MTDFSMRAASPVSRSSNIAQWPGTKCRTIVDHPADDWHRKVSERIQELIRLPVGWDGYAGTPVKFETGMFTCTMLQALWRWDTPVPQIVPGPSGDLQVEWHMADNTVELHVISPNRVSAWRSMSGEDPDGQEIILSNDFAPIEEWIERLTGPNFAVEATAL